MKELSSRSAADDAYGFEDDVSFDGLQDQFFSDLSSSRSNRADKRSSKPRSSMASGTKTHSSNRVRYGVLGHFTRMALFLVLGNFSQMAFAQFARVRRVLGWGEKSTTGRRLRCGV